MYQRRCNNSRVKVIISFFNFFNLLFFLSSANVYLVVARCLAFRKENYAGVLFFSLFFKYVLLTVDFWNHYCQEGH